MRDVERNVAPSKDFQIPDFHFISFFLFIFLYFFYRCPATAYLQRRPCCSTMPLLRSTPRAICDDIVVGHFFYRKEEGFCKTSEVTNA